jgi:hypothetical protein
MGCSSTRGAFRIQVPEQQLGSVRQRVTGAVVPREPALFAERVHRENCQRPNKHRPTGAAIMEAAIQVSAVLRGGIALAYELTLTVATLEPVRLHHT